VYPQQLTDEAESKVSLC